MGAAVNTPHPSLLPQGERGGRKEEREERHKTG